MSPVQITYTVSVNHYQSRPAVAAPRDDDDYDIDFYTADQDTSQSSTREQLEVRSLVLFGSGADVTFTLSVLG